MRLLHQRHDHHHSRVIMEESPSVRRANTICFGWESVPLWIAPAHLVRRETGNNADVGGGDVMGRREQHSGGESGQQIPKPSGRTEAFTGRLASSLDDWLAIEPPSWRGPCWRVELIERVIPGQCWSSRVTEHCIEHQIKQH
jgi:hypothetical protein